jgi:hypothetical protein
MHAFRKATIRRGSATLAVLALTLLAAGCSSSERLFGGQTSSVSASPSSNQSSPSTMKQIADLVLQKPEPPTPEERRAAIAGVANNTCPPLNVRTGASTLVVPPGNTEAFSLRYQGSLGDMARECTVSGGIMHMRIGIQGRVLVGPAGGPGTVDIPLRFAVVKEGPEPKTVVSKLDKLQVAVPEGQQNVLFSHVDSEVAFPMPPDLEIETYVVYIGFDPLAEKQQPKKPQAKKPKARS